MQHDLNKLSEGQTFFIILDEVLLDFFKFSVVQVTHDVIIIFIKVLILLCIIYELR